ncbi:MAG: hypothetical protein Q27BPR15_14960 [Rhodobacter sp. CACIA14H1]|nr:MAG: hypothetical protein Q27BPR15_14960 [Rhodobacter sp. CACIA14H1]
MEKGQIISGVAHAGVILWVVLGDWLFRADTLPEMQVAEVSLMSSAEFDALVASAPKPVEQAEAEPAAEEPVVTPPEPVQPEETPPPARGGAPAAARGAAARGVAAGGGAAADRDARSGRPDSPRWSSRSPCRRRM